MESMRAWGMVLIVGAVATLIWLSICPVYEVIGDSRTIDRVHVSPVTRRVGNSTMREGGGEPLVAHQHPDAVVFFAGTIAIWSATCGVCLLRRETLAALLWLRPGGFDPKIGPPPR